MPKSSPQTGECQSARDAAAAVAGDLRRAGHTAYFAGGCVRDHLLGYQPNDFDVATDATPDQIASIFQRAHGVGVAFGVMLVRRGGHTVEVTTFRADGGYSDGRRPDEVLYADAVQDARRRDFTINALLEDPETGEIIDHVGGRADLAGGLIRAIGDPEKRFQEDHLRMLRAVRFAARLGFTIEPATAEAIRHRATHLEGVSRERIGQEIEWMLAHPSRATAVRLIEELGLDAVVLREDHIESGSRRLSLLPAAAEFAVALAAWWLDRSSAAGGTPRDPATWRAALMLSNDAEQAFVGSLNTRQALLSQWNGLPVARQKRLAASVSFDGGLLLVQAEHPDVAAAVRARVEQLAATGLRPPPLVTGDTLVALGFQPGPSFKKVLEEVYDAQLEGRVTSQPQASAFATRLLGGGKTA